MTKLVSTLFFVLISVAALVAQPRARCEKPYAPEGGAFSFCPPDSLHPVQATGEQFSYFYNNVDPKKSSMGILIFQVKTSETLRESAYDQIEEALSNEKGQGVIKSLSTFDTAYDDQIQGTRILYEKTTAKPPGTARHDREVYIEYMFLCPGGQVGFIAIIPTGDTAAISMMDDVIRSVVIKKK